jgi:ketosteroid isomerase-like protein
LRLGVNLDIQYRLQVDGGDIQKMMTATDTVLEFMERINRRDAEGLAALMTEDHVFTDSLGQTVRGREKMRAGWKGYFAFCPDYWVSHEDIFAAGDRVGVFGAAGGTIAVEGRLVAENKWRTGAAWLAVVEGGLVKEWRVYADNKAVYEIMARLKPNPGG